MPPAYLRGPAATQPILVFPAVCSGKVQFADPGAAVAVLRRKLGETREHYRCRHCGAWHIGTPSPPVGSPAMRAALVRAE